MDRIWNLSSVPKLKEFVFAVQDEERRALAVQVIENFQSSVVPHYGKLARGPIHGDLNEQNILGNFMFSNDIILQFHHSFILPYIVKPVEGQSDKYMVSGILDFGDIHHNYYIFDIAIAICYMVLSYPCYLQLAIFVEMKYFYESYTPQMLECKSMDILDAPGHVLAGYCSLRSMPDLEFDLLKAS